MESYQIRITGTVQGVFFRQSAKEKADELGITGYARNLPDGSVYVAAEGEPTALEQFISWCNTGPELASVRKVECVKAAPKGYPDFSVKR